MRKTKFIPAIALMLGALVLNAHVIRAEPAPSQITVLGTGILQQPPTVLVLEVAVGFVGATADEAIQRANERAEELITDFRRFGLKPEDWSRNVAIARRPIPEEPKKLAFWGTVTLTVRLDEFGAAAEMMDRATELKTAAIDFRYELDDPMLEYERALKRALADAQFKAEALAKEVGLKIGALLSCEEISEPPLGWVSDAGASSSASGRSSGVSVPAQRRAADYRTHEITTMARVRASFALNK